MRKDTTTRDAMAAAALARNIRTTDDNLNLHAAAEAGVCSYENPARFHTWHDAVLEQFLPHSLHEQIVANSVAASLWSQKRYRGVETGLLDANVRDQWDQVHPGSSGAAPARRLQRAFFALTPAERATLTTLDLLHHHLHRSARANADRLAKARRTRDAAAKKEATRGR